MVSRTKVAWLTVSVLVSLILVVLSMSLALAGEDEFDVGVFKSDDPSYVTAGESLSYTILVTNSQWGITATNVTVTDTLPPEVSHVADTGGCSEDAGVLSCPVADLEPGGEISFTIDVDVAPDAFNPLWPTICNNVEVAATTQLGEPDTDLTNNESEVCTSVWGEADLAMEKTVFPGDVVPVGEWFTYTLRAENLGPSTSWFPMMVDWFATDGSITVMPSGEEREWGMCGPMPTDQGWAETPAWLMTWVDSLCGVSDLPWCEHPYFWMEAWWYYWYHNFPPMYPYPLAVNWMCVWHLWDMDPGDYAETTVNVLPLDAQTIYNQAWVLPDLFPRTGMDGFEEYEFYGTYDPYLFNNVDELTTFVTDEADLQVVKVSKPDDQVDAGLPFTYTIFVENLGPAPATEVSIRDEMLSSGSFDIVDVILDPSRDDEGPVELPSPEGGVTMEFHLLEPLEPKGPDNQGRWVIQMVLQAAETQDVNNMVQVFTREGGSFDPDLSNNQDEDRIAVGDVADLGIEKWWEEAPREWFYEMPYGFDDCYLYEETNLVGVRAGCPLRFQLGVGNAGPSLAENVVVEDVLPAGVTVEGVGPSQGSCTTGIPGDPSAPLTCNLGNIPAGEGAGIEVFVMTDVDLAWEPLENDALVYSDIFDPDNGNNRAHVLIWVEPFSYLYIDKEGPPEILGGEEIEYWIHLRNEGPSTAHDVYLDDELPGGVSLISADVMMGDGSCAPGSALCSLGDLEPWEGRGVRVRGYVEPWLDEGTLITNTVRGWAHSPFYQPIPDEPISDTWETQVHSMADLSVWKEAEPWKLYAGEQVMYSIEVSNNGPGMAHGVFLTDTLPPQVEFELVTSPACYPVDGMVECYWDDFPAGHTSNFYIFGRVLPEAEPGTVSNQVLVGADTFDPAEYNDYASAPILIQGRADLKIQKFGKPEGEVRAGDELIYTVIVDNLGTGFAHEVTIDDVLESDGSFDLLEVTSDRDALCDPESGTFENDMFLSCALSDTLEVKGPEPGSGRWMVTVVVRANEPQDINNVAYVAGADYDPDLSNNEAMAEHEITSVADLELTKEAWGEMLVGCEGETELWLDEVAAGSYVTYTLTVSNTGPSTAENVTVLDEPLPYSDLLEIDVESIEPSQGECLTAEFVDERRLNCNLGTLGPQEMATVSFVGYVPSWVPDYTVLINDAQVYSDMFDDNNGNDVVSNQTIVSRVADLEVLKTQDPEIALPYWDVTYSITVTNLGPSDVEGLFISDTIPVQVLDPQWTCCASDDGDCQIPCELPVCPEGDCPWPDDVGLYAQADIPAGEWAIYTVTGTLDWWPCGPFTNTVTLIPPESLTHPPEDIDPCDENNTDIAVNDPFCHYDPLVLKDFPGPDSTD
jgi:uncharacterized repeat protein (TIGR01451 family)